MSGPATAAFSFTPLGAIALAAMALREAHKMGREYHDVLDELQRHAAGLADIQRQSRTAKFAQLAATRQQVTQLETQLGRLLRMATAMGLAESALSESSALARAPCPTAAHPQAWQWHLEALSASVAALQFAIAAARPAAASAVAAAADTVLPPVENALHVYMVQRALHAHLDEAQADSIRVVVARLLARLNLEVGEAMPADLDALAQSIALSPNRERAEALALELRLRIQQHAKERALQRNDAAEARRLLEQLGEEVPAELRSLLVAVLLGARLHPETRELVAQTLQAQEALRKKLEGEAAAQVLEQSLRDLGYEVDGVEDTFFIEGGVAHFQRHGWGEYFVRMRVETRDKTLNFNVVRAKGAQETAERKRLDYLAEDRWCSEFPKLLDTMAARGIQLDVTRLLGAGDLPVQAVDPATVPAAPTEQLQAMRSKLREMKP